MTNSTVTQQRLDLTWRMLATLGAPARSQPISSTAVDPECALVLAAIGGGTDARAEEMATWFARSTYRSLSLTRTKSLAATWGNQAHEALARLGNAVAHIPELRQWTKRFGTATASHDETGASSDRLISNVGAEDLSPSITTAPGAFRLRMRLAFGVGARTEALAALIVHGHADPDSARSWMTLPDLAQATGFGKRHLLDSLPDMARAGLLDHQRPGRSHQFRIRRGMFAELGPTPSAWLDWPSRIAALLALEQSIDEVSTHGTVSATLDAHRSLTAHAPALTSPFVVHDGTEAIAERFLTWAMNEAASLVAVT